MLKHCDAQPPPLQQLAPDTPALLCRIIHRLLRKDPARLFQSAEDVLEALERSDAGPAVSAAAATRTAPGAAGRRDARRRAKRRIALLAALGGAAAVILALVLVLLLDRRSEAPKGHDPPGGALRTPSSSAEPRAARLAESLRDFEKAHGRTKLYATLAKPLEALRTRIVDATGRYTKWPFDAAEARRRQLAMARTLDVRIEQEIDVGKGVKLYGGKVEQYQRGRPQHRVRITRPFWLGKYEATQEQWPAVMGSNPSKFRGRENPVETVTWPDCQRFLANLNERSQRARFRFPTEAEWEYACRAGTATRFCFGDAKEKLGYYAWTVENSEGVTHSVGRTRPNVGARRVLRGGSWNSNAHIAHSASRDGRPPDIRHNFIGFRVARSLPQPLAPSPCPSEARGVGFRLPILDLRFGKTTKGVRRLRKWLRTVTARFAIKFSGRLAARHATVFRAMGFDRDDWPFVGVCSRTRSKNLVSEDSDYTPEVREYLLAELGVSVMSVQEALRH